MTVFPDYYGGSIVNLMSAVAQGMGGWNSGYLPCPALDEERLAQVRNLVLLVIDGLGYHYLQRQAGDSWLFRHCSDSLTSVCPSTTATAIPAFLTGLPPQQHGFTGWFTYFSELGSILTVLPHTHRLGRSPVDDQLLSPRHLCGVPPIYDRLDANSHLVMPDWIADSAFNRAFTGTASIRPYRGGMQGFVRGIRQVVDSGRRRNFVYAYWPEFDSLAHHHGVESEVVSRHLQALEREIGGLVDRLAGSDTLLMITADHGFIDTTPERTLRLAHHPELARTLMMPLCGEPRLAFCYVHPDRTGAFEDYVASELSEAVDLVPSRSLLQDERFGLGQPHPRLMDRIGHYALLMKENYIITSELPGEQPLAHVGVHGGLSPAEMFVPLISLDLAHDY